MALKDCLDPIIDKQVRLILEGLAGGKERGALAQELGYKHPVSMDNYMRRKNFSWDSPSGTFVPASDKYAKKETMVPEHMANTMQGAVVLEFQKHGNDARLIAKNLGFPDHRQMALFMAEKGYEWDATIVNYRKKGDADSAPVSCLPIITETQPVMKTTPAASETVGNHVQAEHSNEEHPSDGDITKYLPILELLYKNRTKLSSLLDVSPEGGPFPRYTIPGTCRAKTFQMSMLLAEVVGDFCNEYNLSQKELLEIAIIDFFKKYGSAPYVHRLLGQ